MYITTTPLKPSSMVITYNPTTTTNILFFHPSSKLVPSASSTPSANSTKFRSKAVITCDDDQATSTQRRSGNYKPSVWDFDFIQSSKSEFNKEEKHLKRASELTVQVEMMLREGGCSIRQLELIDDLQRLGISYHFKDEIKHILESIYYINEEHYEDLHAKALRFRLLRQHGFNVPQEVFDRYKNDKGDFKESLVDDTKGLLQLYEASFMLRKGEDTLELARQFTTKNLEKIIIDDDDESLSILVQNALEIPLHWRIPKLSARWFIDSYERRRANMNPILLEFAKLDFNIVQATYQEELRHVSRWWKETRLAEKMPFARNWLVECYFFSLFVHLEPQYGYSRIMATKANALVTVIDDAFDVYATLEELKLFVNAIQRWDAEALDKLPNYMKTWFITLNNFINEMASDVYKEQRLLIISHLRKSWQDLLQTYLQEAEYYSKGYTPKMEDYISNACSSSSGLVGLSHAYFLVTNPIEEEAVQSCLYNHDQYNIIQYSGLILRLANDLATSAVEMERGDVPKAVQCYVNETGASVEEAREFVEHVIYETWMKMNEDSHLFPPEFVRIATDLARMAQYMYQHENSREIQYAHMKNRISSILFEPIY